MVFSLKVENAFKEELERLFHYARMAEESLTLVSLGSKVNSRSREEGSIWYMASPY